MTRIDLVSQVQGRLPRLYGGTGSDRGYGWEGLLIPFVNDSGSSLARGTVVTRTSATALLHPTNTLGERVIGVVVGRLSTTGEYEDEDVGTDETAVVLVSGRCDILTTTAATRGQYLRASATPGLAVPSSTPIGGTFAYVLYAGSSSVCQALIASTGDVPITDHGGLSGLGDDDHAAYVTVTGGGGETLSTVAATGGSETVDLDDGNVHDLTLTADCTLALTGATPGVACSLTLLLRQDGTGGWTVIWPGTVEWPDGMTPTLASDPDAVDVFSLFTLDGGTVWYGFHANGSESLVAALDDLTDVVITSPAEGSRLRYDGAQWVDSLDFPVLLIADDHSSPLVFGDLLQTEEGDDLLYSDA